VVETVKVGVRQEESAKSCRAVTALISIPVRDLYVKCMLTCCKNLPAPSPSSLLWKQNGRLRFLPLAALFLPEAAVGVALPCVLHQQLKQDCRSASLSLGELLVQQLMEWWKPE